MSNEQTEPTPAHLFIKALHEAGLLQRWYTQVYNFTPSIIKKIYWLRFFSLCFYQSWFATLHIIIKLNQHFFGERRPCLKKAFNKFLLFFSRTWTDWSWRLAYRKIAWYLCMAPGISFLYSFLCEDKLCDVFLTCPITNFRSANCIECQTGLCCILHLT